MTWSPKHPAFQSLLAALSAATKPVYVVGGVIRDALLGNERPATDLDVVIGDSAIPVARTVADRLGWAFYALDPLRDVARLVFTATNPPLVCDIATLRGGSIEIDLLTRDFTVNAIAVEWEGRRVVRTVDPTGGTQDIERRCLRRVTPTSLPDDPVRMLRAFRFALQLDFTIEDETLAQIIRMPDTVRLISPERVRDELWKMLSSKAPEQALADLQTHSLLFPILPEITELIGVAQSAPHVSDVWTHTLRTVAYARDLRNWIMGKRVVDDSPAAAAWQAALEPWRYRLREHFLKPITGDHQRVDWLVWYALWHDAGKAAAASHTIEDDGSLRYRFLGHEDISAQLAVKRLSELRFSRVEWDLTEMVVRAHMRPHHLHDSFRHSPISRRACYRFFRDTGGHNQGDLAGVDILLLALADYQAIYAAPQPPEWREYLDHIVQLLAFAFGRDGLASIQQPLVDGYTIMRHLNLEPGPTVGILLERIREAQAAGEITSRTEALALASAGIQELQGQ